MPRRSKYARCFILLTESGNALSRLFLKFRILNSCKFPMPLGKDVSLFPLKCSSLNRRSAQMEFGTFVNRQLSALSSKSPRRPPIECGIRLSGLSPMFRYRRRRNFPMELGSAVSRLSCTYKNSVRPLILPMEFGSDCRALCPRSSVCTSERLPIFSGKTSNRFSARIKNCRCFNSQNQSGNFRNRF